MRFENISINDILERAYKEQGYIVDVRDVESYLNGHIKGAINIPLEEIEDGNFYLDRKYPILVYCDRGASSLMATRYLIKQNYRVINTVGGIRQYKGKLEKI